MKINDIRKIISITIEDDVEIISASKSAAILKYRDYEIIIKKD